MSQILSNVRQKPKNKYSIKKSIKPSCPHILLPVPSPPPFLKIALTNNVMRHISFLNGQQ